MKRALVTGASGFVGANLARRLLHEGHEVHLLLRPGFAPWRIEGIRRDVHLHQVQLDDADAVRGTVEQSRPEWVFHLAAHGAYPAQTDIHEMVRTNILGTINLIDACLGTAVEVVVNTGSSSEYGFKDHAPSEDERLDPNSSYAVTKASATLFCRHTAQSRSARIPTLRLYSVYGPYEEPTRLIPTVILRGLRGELPPLVDPGVARDYVYVDDVIDAYLLAVTCPAPEPGAVYNVGTGVQTSLREVVEVAREVLALRAEPQWGSMTGRSWDTNVWVADSKKIRRELGWQPSCPFTEGFRKTVDWFRGHPALRERYERRQANVR